MDNVIVIGATGMLGSEVCRLLATTGKHVKALVRTSSDPAKVSRLEHFGVKTVYGDVRDPASLKTAFEGINAVISTLSSVPFSYQAGQNDIQTTDLEGSKNLIAAAKGVGVKHFVYTSFSKNIDLDFPLRGAKRTVEEELKKSGLEYAILRPSYFMEVWFSPTVGFDVSKGKAQVYGSGEAPISWISYKDVARFAVDSLHNPAARNATLELGGPEALTPRQAVGLFEQVGGRKLELSYVSVEALRSQLKAATDPMQQSLSGLMLCYANGDKIEMGETLKAFPLRLTTVLNYAKSLPVGV